MKGACLSVPSRWLFGILLLIILCLLRFPWLEADPGNSGMWSYGYFKTDEGAYTSGGRLAYLSGKFYDSELNGPSTIKLSFGMHVLSYLGHLALGLNLGSARLPVMVFAVLGWMAVYFYLTKRTNVLLAFFLVVLIAHNPVNLTYERTASEDVIVGAVAVICSTLLSKPGRWRVVAAGLLFGFGITVKISLLLFAPMITLYVLTRSNQRVSSLLTGLLGATAALVIMALWYSVSVNPLIQSSHLVAFTQSLTFNPFESLRAIATFPRVFLISQYGFLLLWGLFIPLTYFCLQRRKLKKFKLSLDLAIVLGTAIYTLVFAAQRVNAVRYFLPLSFLIPIIVVRGRGLLQGIPRKYVIGAFGFVITGMVIYWSQQIHGLAEIDIPHIQEVEIPRFDLMSKEVCLRFIHLTAGFLIFRKLFSELNSIVLLVVLAIINQVIFCGGPFDDFSPNKVEMQNHAIWFISILLMLVVLFTKSWKTWYLTFAATFLLTVVGNVCWHSAYSEIFMRRFTEKEISERISKEIPSDSIVLGRVATSLFRATPFRLGHWDNVAQDIYIEKSMELLNRYPNKPIYWLVGDNAFIKEASNVRALGLIATSLDSFSLRGDSADPIQKYILVRLERN